MKLSLRLYEFAKTTKLQGQPITIDSPKYKENAGMQRTERCRFVICLKVFVSRLEVGDLGTKGWIEESGGVAILTQPSWTTEGTVGRVSGSLETQ